MKALVVGGAGYIGGLVTDYLLKSNHKVTVYGSLIYEEVYRKEHKNLRFVYGDIRDKDLLRNELNQTDCVIWLAALVGDGACALNPELTFEVNTNSLNFLVDNFSKKIIFLSTCSVYGIQKEEGLLTETSEVNPVSIYAESKLRAEKILLRHNNTQIFRLGTVFGVGDNFSRIRLDLVVNIMVAKAHEHKKIKVFGGEQWRPLISVKDVTRIIVKNIESIAVGIYNVSKENIKMIDLGNRIKDFFKYKDVEIDIEIEDIPFQDTRNYKVSNDKMKYLLEFEPKYSIEDGMEDLYRLISSKRIKDINNYRFNNANFLKEILHV